jgi:hypothetical protein
MRERESLPRDQAGRTNCGAITAQYENLALEGAFIAVGTAVTGAACTDPGSFQKAIGDLKALSIGQPGRNPRNTHNGPWHPPIIS